MRKTDNTGCWRGQKHLEPYLVGWNGKLHNHFEKLFGTFFIKLHTPTLWHSNSTPRYLFKTMKTQVYKKTCTREVYCSFIYIVKTCKTQMSLTRKMEKQILGHLYNGTWLINKNKWTSDTHTQQGQSQNMLSKEIRSQRGCTVWFYLYKIQEQENLWWQKSPVEIGINWENKGTFQSRWKWKCSIILLRWWL